MQAPETRFASVGNGRVAYQLLGEGAIDLVHSNGLWSQVDVMLEDPSSSRYLERLASFARVILFDARGSGRSDARPADGGSIADHWSEDLLAVLDDAGSTAPALVGMSDAGPLLLRFVAQHPERCSRLILFGTTASVSAAPDYPIGFTDQQIARFEKFMRDTWGTETWARWYFPSLARNEAGLRWVAKWTRAQAPLGTALANVREIAAIDARPGLAKIAVPVLVIVRREPRLYSMAHSQYIAERVPGARLVEIPGADGMPLWEASDQFVELAEEFLTGRHSEPRALATLLFTDVVDSTRRAAELGDAAWRQLLDQHDRAVRHQVELHRGRLVDHAGDGTLATFDHPDAAIECAFALHRVLAPLGVQIRTGLHTGTVELRGDGRIGGVAVHLGARVLVEARGGEVLVSRTVRDVLLGSRYAFVDRGTYELKGVPDRWSLYAVSASGT